MMDLRIIAAEIIQQAWQDYSRSILFSRHHAAGIIQQAWRDYSRTHSQSHRRKPSCSHSVVYSRATWHPFAAVVAPIVEHGASVEVPEQSVTCNSVVEAEAAVDLDGAVGATAQAYTREVTATIGAAAARAPLVANTVQVTTTVALQYPGVSDTLAIQQVAEAKAAQKIQIWWRSQLAFESESFSQLVCEMMELRAYAAENIQRTWRSHVCRSSTASSTRAKPAQSSRKERVGSDVMPGHTQT
jgi:hypothetical protein